MSVTRPHFSWPFRLGLVVEQDSDAELDASAAVVACTPRGHRTDLPAFGVTVAVFDQGPLDLERLAAEIAQCDPRLDLDAEESFDQAAATVRTIRVAVQGG